MKASYLLKWLFLLMAVWILSDSLSASGWKRLVGITIGIAGSLSSILTWKRGDVPLSPDDRIGVTPSTETTIPHKSSGDVGQS